MDMSADRHLVPGLPDEMSLTQSQTWIDEVVRRFNTVNVDAIMSCFDDDVLVDYAGEPPIKGRAALLAFMTPRYNRIRDYSLRKRVRCVTGRTVGIDATVVFTEAETDRRVKGRAFEFLMVRNGLIAAWDNVVVYHNQEDAP